MQAGAAHSMRTDRANGLEATRGLWQIGRVTRGPVGRSFENGFLQRRTLEATGILGQGNSTGAAGEGSRIEQSRADNLSALSQFIPEEPAIRPDTRAVGLATTGRARRAAGFALFRQR